MKQIALASIALTLASQQAYAQLDELIKQNIRGARESYEETFDIGEQRTGPPRLWLLIQSDNQMQVAQQILSSLGDDYRGESRMELKPVQKVDFGPSESQLRYFRQIDEEQVQQVLDQLKDIVPEIVLRDLSSEYMDVDWIKPGHYELWLSPDLMRVTPPE